MTIPEPHRTWPHNLDEVAFGNPGAVQCCVGPELNPGALLRMQASSSAVFCSRPIIAKSNIRAAAWVRLSRTDHELSAFLVALKRCWCLSPTLIFRFPFPILHRSQS